jgi:hypothetical protein
MVLVHVKLILWFYDMQLVWMLLPDFFYLPLMTFVSNSNTCNLVRKSLPDVDSMQVSRILPDTVSFEAMPYIIPLVRVNPRYV